MTAKLRVFALLGFLAVALCGIGALATPAAAAGCEPVACPAIAKLCPDGEIACRVSPCNCTQVCVPQGRGCNA
jgi:hypothetical protein